MEVNGRDGCDGISTNALGMGSQLHAVCGVVTAYMSNDGKLSLCLLHNSFQDFFALIHVLVNALAGRTAHIHTLHTFGNQMAG